MQLNSVHLENFRAHRDRLFEFGSGLTVIVGPNGSGKTTALEAFVWALYGTTAARGKADSILPISGNGKPEVTAEFTMEPNTWTVTRSLNKATISNGTTEVASTLKGVTTYIEELFGMTREEFHACVFATQKEMAWLKGKSGPERQRFLSKIQGHDVIRQAQKVARDLERKFKSAVEIAMSAVSDHIVTDEDVECALSEAEAGEATAEVSITKQKQASDELLQATAALSEEKTRSDAHSVLVSALSTAATRHKDAQDAILRAMKAVRDLPEPGGPEALQAALQELQGATAGSNQDVESGRTEMSRIEASLSVVSANIKRSSDSWKRLDKLGPGTPCDACGQEMDPVVHADHMGDLKSEILQYREEKEKVEGFLQTAKDAHAEAVVRAGHHQHAVDCARAAVTKEEQAARDRDRAHSDKASAVNTATVLLAGLGDARADLEVSDYDSAHYEELVQQHKDASEELQEATRNSIALNKTAVDARANYARLKITIEAQVTAKARIAKSQEETAMYGAVDDVFSGLTNSLNESLRPVLSAMATEIVSETTGGRFDSLELDESYTPQLYADGVRLPVISGGEEDIVSLALRISVGQIIAANSGSPIGMLVMDEPFGSLDEERQRLVMDMLAKLCEDRFNQIIVITHTMGIRDGADHIIELGAPEPAEAETVAA